MRAATQYALATDPGLCFRPSEEQRTNDPATDSSSVWCYPGSPNMMTLWFQPFALNPFTSSRTPLCLEPFHLIAHTTPRSGAQQKRPASYGAVHQGGAYTLNPKP